MQYIKDTLLIIVTGVFAAAAFWPSKPAQAGLWDSVSALGNHTIESVAFSVETSGQNLRGYYFTAPDGRSCIWVISSKSQQLDCDWPQ